MSSTPVRIKGRYLVDGGLVNEVPVSVCREMGAEYVIGVNVIPEPRIMLPKLKKSQITRTHQAAKSDEMEYERKLTMLPEVPSQFIQSRVDDIENSIRKFLLYQNKLKSKMLKSLDWLRMETPQIFRLKKPFVFFLIIQDSPFQYLR